MGRKLAKLDDNRCFRLFGFGDSRTREHSVFSFFDDAAEHTATEAVERYRTVIPSVQLSGKCLYNQHPLLLAFVARPPSRGQPAYSCASAASIFTSHATALRTFVPTAQHHCSFGPRRRLSALLLAAVTRMPRYL